MDYDEGIELLAKVNELYPDNDFNAIWIVDPNKAIDSENSMELNGYQILYSEGIKDSIITQ